MSRAQKKKNIQKKFVMEYMAQLVYLLKLLTVYGKKRKMTKKRSYTPKQRLIMQLFMKQYAEKENLIK